MNDGLIETLLNSEESATLDFKRKQYPFAGASAEAKAELLKDILAFANAWRPCTAYILIGVEEVKGGRSIVHGLTEGVDDLDDADLQQFISGKTNTPVEFHYTVQQFEGKRIGIIEVPMQTRPFWIRKEYGKVLANAVYYRRGSSTHQADPDEIDRMRHADANTQQQSDPTITVQWCDLGTRQLAGQEARVNCVLYAKPEKKLPGAAQTADIIGRRVIRNPFANNEYWRELADYLQAQLAVQPLHLCLVNNSSRLAENVRLVLKLSKDDTLAMAKSDLPTPPRKEAYGAFHMSHVPGLENPTVTDLDDHWEIEFEMGSIQPKAKAHSHTPFYVGAMESRKAEFETTVYADNIGEPQRPTLSLDIEVEQRPALTMDDLRAYDEQTDRA